MIEFHTMALRGYSKEETTSYVMPAALHDGAWQIWAVCVLYLIVGLTALYGFQQAVRSKGATYFRISFLGVSVAFCVLRGILSLVFFNWVNHVFLMYFLTFFMPVYLQYWIYSLLILFVMKCLFVIHDKEEQVHKTLYPMYHMVQLALFLVCVVAAYFLAHTWDSDSTDKWDKKPSMYVAVLYGLLVGTGLFYFRKSYRMLDMATSATDRKDGLKKYLFLIPVYIMIFFLRALWNTLYYFGANPVQKLIAGYIRHDRREPFLWAYLVFYFVFEIFPTAMVVLIFTFKIANPTKKRDIAGSPMTPSSTGSNPGTPFYGRDRIHEDVRWNMDALEPLVSDNFSYDTVPHSDLHGHDDEHDM